MNSFYGFLIIVMLVFLVSTLIYYFWKTDHYMDNLRSIRKTYYVMFFTIVGVGVIMEYFVIVDWKLLALIAVIVVFIDLSVFTTPDILKIGNAEFQNNYVKRTLELNVDAIKTSANKVEKLANVVVNTAPILTTVNQPSTWEEYREELKRYLNLYADPFQLNVSFFKFDSPAIVDDLAENIEEAFRDAELFFDKNIESFEWRNQLIQELSKGNSVQFMDVDIEKEDNSKRTVFIVVFFGKNYNMLVGVSSDFAELNGVDASNVLSLVQIFDWYM